MPTRDEMMRKVNEHLILGSESLANEPMTGALWLRQKSPEAWLVEIMPRLPDDFKTAYKPLTWKPDRCLPYRLHLIAGNLKSLKRAVWGHRTLARDVARAETLMDTKDSRTLVREAIAAVRECQRSDDSHQTNTVKKRLRFTATRHHTRFSSQI